MLAYILHEPSLIYDGDEPHHSHRESDSGGIEVKSICIELCRHRLYCCESESRSERQCEEEDDSMRKVKICEMHCGCLSMFFWFFEVEVDREDIHRYNETTEHDNRWDARHGREESSYGRSDEECCTEGRSHESHISSFLMRTRNIRYIGLYHAESCTSESSDESCQQKEEKERAHSHEYIAQMIHLKSSCHERRMSHSSPHIDMDTPDTHEHDDITHEVDDTRICQHLPPSICIRKSTKK